MQWLRLNYGPMLLMERRWRWDLENTIKQRHDKLICWYLPTVINDPDKDTERKSQSYHNDSVIYGHGEAMDKRNIVTDKNVSVHGLTQTNSGSPSTVMFIVMNASTFNLQCCFSISIYTEMSAIREVHGMNSDNFDILWRLRQRLIQQ